jgi:sulfite exporter TauE/SafE
MAVVGGLVLAISSKRNQTTQEQSFGKKIVPHFWFNAGRIVGFAVFGGILGFLGQAISLSPFMMSVMIFIVGIVMFLLGVNVSQLSPKLSSLSLSLPVGKWFTAGEADLLKGKQR